MLAAHTPFISIHRFVNAAIQIHAADAENAVFVWGYAAFTMLACLQKRHSCQSKLGTDEIVNGAVTIATTTPNVFVLVVYDVVNAANMYIRPRMLHHS